MEKDLVKLYDNITAVNKDVVKYEDKDGNLKLLPISALLCGIEHQKIGSEDVKKVMIYNKELDKDVVLEKAKAMTQVDKSTITKNEKDFGTIVDKEIDVELCWKVTNGLGFSKVYGNKAEALRFVGEINDRFIKIIEGN